MAPRKENILRDTNLIPFSSVVNDVMPSLIDCAMCAEPESIDASGIVQIFDEAINHKLRWPRIRLVASDGSTLVLRRAGEKSKRPGVIHLTDGTGYPSV